MRLSEQTWSTLISKVRLGRDEYRVVRPARAVKHAMLYEGQLGAELSVDKRAAVVLAMAWGLAAGSPHSLIYLPLRAARPADSANQERLLDLVLLHHRLAFPVSRWKQVRARLGPGRPHGVRLPPQAFRQRSVGDRRPWPHQDFRDHLRWDIAADTLFLIGSREAFELEADPVRALAEGCPRHLAESPDAHCCAEISLGRMGYPDRRRPWAELHVEYCQHHR
ncbi:hypothetical protein [Microbispora sp. GKU 823]|uniref:hypothetical protein n=1 Tax=Microbispora sp. GKU 823 TaxID=1652100 RepID=UPI0009A3570E|nr:hypothetical protein [Microbispora sp. GKU 823]OPG14252.1 hypothetical protein B1L11_03995 [Microbispora sp. GKU 823]